MKKFHIGISMHNNKFKSLLSNRNYTKRSREVETGAAGGVREREKSLSVSQPIREKNERVLLLFFKMLIKTEETNEEDKT